MHIAKVPNRNARPSFLLRETYREDGKVKNRTLANLSKLPVERIETLRAALRGDPLAPIGEAGFEIRRSLPHGHVLAALATARRIGLDDLLPRRAPQRRRDLALGLIVARLLDPAAKLATARMLDSETAAHSLGETLGLGRVTAREIYTTLDWLGSEQTFIENQLARRHLKNGALVLYDVTSTYLEGRCCPLARHGYSRDSRGDRPQLVIGLLCAADGCPVAVEVFEGNTADPATVASQIAKLKQRFRLRHVVLVGDRGMLTSARIDQALRPAGLDWITALRGPAIQQLAQTGTLQFSLFDTRDMAEITSPDYPGERLVVCKNPLLAEERQRKRDELLALTEADLRKIQARVSREKNPLRGAGEIGKAVGAVLNKGCQALRADHHRSFVRIHPQGRGDRRRSPLRWLLRAAHQPRGGTDRHRGNRAGLQKFGPGGARVPLHEDRRSGVAPGVPLDRAAGACACAVVYAGVLRRMAHAPDFGADAVRRS